MLSAFLIALREGVEASLIVGIILVYLSRTNRKHLARYVWGGVAAAVALSLAVAIALDRFNISEDGFEGLLLLVAAFFVVTMILWMNKVARHLKKEIEAKVEAYATRAGSAAGWGLGLFVFLMVVREGAELALILRAVELSTEGLQTWIGTIAGIGAAVAVGLFFFKGTLKVPLHRFFAVTSAILILVAVQLAVTGMHELSEARWIPSSKTEMAVLGPIVRNELFFFIFVFGAAALMILREWQAASHSKATAATTMNDAERRLTEAQNRGQRRWMIAAASMSLAVILALTADFIYAKVNSAPPQAQIRGGGERHREDSGRGSAGRQSASFYAEGERAVDPLHGDQEAEWLWNGFGCVPDLRSGWLPAGGAECDLPALRVGYIYSIDRTEGRLQSDRIYVSGRWRQTW